MKRLGLILMTLALAAGSNLAADKLVLFGLKVEIRNQVQAYADAWGKANGIEVVNKGSTDYWGEMKSMYASGDVPDIFTINGPAAAEEWGPVLADLSGQDWIMQTDFAYKLNGKVVGMPVAIEGWGMAYNTDILKKAGVDPKGLTSLAAYKSAFAKIDSQKVKLGLNAVVSMAASMEMSWVTAHHNVNSLLSNGLQYGDLKVITDTFAGKVDAKRLADYADWVELLFQYSDKAVLTAGNYDAQLGAFATQKTAFLHQGNWVDPTFKAANVTFPMAYAPHGSTSTVSDGVFVAPPTWYVVNKDSKNLAKAKKFLNDMAMTEAGHRFMVTEAGMIPAFKNVKLKPDGQLSQSIQAWSNAGKTFSWNQYYLPEDFRNTTLGPIYNQFAMGQIDKTKFIKLMTDALVSLKK